MARSRKAAPRQTKAEGARVVSAYLDNADVFRTAKGGGPKPNGPAILVLRRRPDFDQRDFDRKARDLVRLGQQGKLKKTKPAPRRLTTNRKTNTPQTKTNIHRHRTIRRLSWPSRRKEANQSVIRRLWDGKSGNITERGQALDPDHVHDLQLGGQDTYGNLRLMDAWTNRQLGGDIQRALANVPEGTPIIVRVID